MTVSSSVSESGPYAGAGQTGPFVIGFRFLDDTHLRVIKSDSAGTETELTLSAEYTATGAGEPNGGSLTLLAPLAAGYTLRILRDVPITQESDYTQSDPFPANSHEEGLDKLTMIAQQHQQRIVQALRVPENAGVQPLPAASVRRNSLLGFDATGAPTLVDQVAAPLRPVVTETHFATAGQTVFTLTNAYVRGVNTLAVFVDGLRASWQLDYEETSSTSVTFLEGLEDGQQVTFVVGTGVNTAADDAALVVYTPAGAGAVPTTVQAKLRDDVSIEDYGGGTAASAAVNAAAIDNAEAAVAAGGVVHFRRGPYSNTFSKPPYGVTWSFSGAPVTRQALGGSSTAVVFQRARLSYIDGPHVTSQVHAEHIRAIAKGSNAIGAPFADYALGLAVEKENWSEASGTPVAGEINALTITTRNGCVTGDPVKTGGAAILADVGATAGSGYTQFAEVVNNVFTKGTLAIEKQTNMKLLGIDQKLGTSYGMVFDSNIGTQTAVMRAAGTTASRWGRIIETLVDGATTFYLDDMGKLRWRVNNTNMTLDQDATTHAVAFRDANGVARLYATQNGYAGHKGVNVQTATSYTLSLTEFSGDLGKCVVMANNVTPATVTLPNSAPVGWWCEVLQRDTAQVTFSPEAGATLQALSGHTKTAGQNAVVRFIVRLNNGGASAIWNMSGDTAA